jgi:hypothetical protein
MSYRNIGNSGLIHIPATSLQFKVKYGKLHLAPGNARTPLGWSPKHLRQEGRKRGLKTALHCLS